MHILRALSMVIAILTGMITIYGFALDQGWLTSETTSDTAEWLTSFIHPDFIEGLLSYSEEIRDNVKDIWPLGPIPTALIIVALVSSIMAIFDRTLFFDEYFVSILFFLPLPLVWVWLFFGEVSVLGVGTLGLLYFSLPYAADLVFFVVSDYLEDRGKRAISGTVRDVQETRQKLLGLQKITIDFIVEQSKDIPIKARYSRFQGTSQRRLLEEGNKVTLSGNWDEGTFEVAEIEDLRRGNKAG